MPVEFTGNRNIEYGKNKQWLLWTPFSVFNAQFHLISLYFTTSLLFFTANFTTAQARVLAHCDTIKDPHTEIACCYALYGIFHQHSDHFPAAPHTHKTPPQVPPHLLQGRHEQLMELRCASTSLDTAP